MLHLITDIKFYTLLLIINTKLAFLNAFLYNKNGSCHNSEFIFCHN